MTYMKRVASIVPAAISPFFVRRALLYLAYVAMFSFALISLFPLYWMFVTALKPTEFVITTPPELFPHTITGENFSNILENGALRWTLNSLIVTVTITGLLLLMSSMAGYSFAKKQFPLKNTIFWIYLSSMMVPIFAMLIPLYKLMVSLGFINTYWGLILPELASPFGVFLMRQYIQTLPNEIFDSGRIDGCSELRLFWSITLPLSSPALVVLAIFIFTTEWSSFIWPLVVTNTSSMATLPVGLSLLQQFETSSGMKDYGLMMAGASWAAVPMIIVFLFLQRYFVRGVTLGALKG